MTKGFIGYRCEGWSSGNRINAAISFLFLPHLPNQPLTVFAASPLHIEDGMVKLLISTIAPVAAALVSWWKNNSMIQAARTADKM